MSRRLLLAVFAVGTVLAAGCGGDDADDTSSTSTSAASTTITTTTTTTTAETDDRLPVVIDTDMSVEGAMSILYLLARPDVRVEAITVSGTGLVTCRKGVDQALGLAALGGAPDIPVACGPAETLGGDNAFPSNFRSAANSLGGIRLPSDNDPSELTAPALLASVIASSPEPVAIYADGPLTNIALMMDEDPSVVDNVAGITLMGGAFDVQGTVFDNPDAEWNIWIDPVAADRVLTAGAPVTIVPLDATNDVPLTVLHLAELEQFQATPTAETTFQLVRSISGLDQRSVYLWDQLNAVVLLDESVVTIEERPVSVVTEGGPEKVGTTVEDANGAMVRVAVAADREAFERTFFTTLLGEPFEPVDLTPDVTIVFDGTEWTHDLPATLPLGSLVLGFENESTQQAAAVVGWLTGDATLEDLDAWESVQQPPFVELAGFAGGPGGSASVSPVEFTVEGEHVLVGLTFAPDSTTRVATFDVG